MLGEFEIYVRSAGFKHRRDAQDRYFIYRKAHRGRFPQRDDVLDHLICLSIMYGDSRKLAID
jgi:hypothetical protein